MNPRTLRGQDKRRRLGRRVLFWESRQLKEDARTATRRSKRLVTASLFARAAATVLSDDAKIERIEHWVNNQSAGLSLLGFTT